MTGSLDTNALLRLALEDLPEQTAAIEKLLSTGTTFEIADAALFEMVYVLERVYRLPRLEVVENMLSIVRNKQFNCNRKLFELALPAYLEHPKLSIVDCALTQYAELNNASPLYTFDTVLAKTNPDTVHLLSSHGS
jgi:predicted nucleic-acid-binding protein